MKKAISVILSLCMLLSITAGLNLTVYADTSGDYEYYLLDDGTVEIAKYRGDDKELVIPSVLDGYTVTSIGYSSFSGRSSLVSVTVPQNIKTICNFAFEECDNLESVILCEGLEKIGYEAFCNCKKLTCFNIPESVIYLADNIITGTEIRKNMEWCDNALYLDNCLLETAWKGISGNYEIKSEQE